MISGSATLKPSSQPGRGSRSADSTIEGRTIVVRVDSRRSSISPIALVIE